MLEINHPGKYPQGAHKALRFFRENSSFELVPVTLLYHASIDLLTELYRGNDFLGDSALYHRGVSTLPANARKS